MKKNTFQLKTGQLMIFQHQMTAASQVRMKTFHLKSGLVEVMPIFQLIISQAKIFLPAAPELDVRVELLLELRP